MRKDIIQAFIKCGYYSREGTGQSQIVYKIMDEGIYIVSVHEVVEANQTEEEILMYRQYVRQIKWDLINQGYRNISVLHVIISNDTTKAKAYIEPGDCYWIINQLDAKLIIYENQKAQFLDARNCIEQILTTCYKKPSFGDKLKQKYQNIRDNKNTIGSMGATLSIIAINIIIFLISDWNNITHKFFVENGGISYHTAINHHEYYRFLTSMFIHSNVNHIFGNMIVLFFIGRELEKRLGFVKYLMLYFIGGVVADCTSLGYNKMYDTGMTMSIGASGAIFAVVGAMIAIVLLNREEFRDIGIHRLLFFVAISILNGIATTGVDNAAHIGGLIGGAIIGYGMYQHRQG